MSVIVVDGVRIQVVPADLDGDGKVGGIEVLPQKFDMGTQDIIQPTELGESLRELNDDSIEHGTRMSGIDMRANIHHMEESGLLAIDALVGFRFLPISCVQFTRQKKRLSVSRNGRGRDDIVNIVGGKSAHEERVGSMGFGDKIKNFMGVGGKES